MRQSHNHQRVLSYLLNMVPVVSDLSVSVLDLDSNLLPDLVQEAQQQGVAPWVFRQLGAVDSHLSLTTFRQSLKTSVLHTLAANELNLSILNEIQLLMESNGIELVLLKGISLVVGLYPEPSLRPIGDIDLYVKPSDVYRAHHLLIQHGAKRTSPPFSSLHQECHNHLTSLIYKGRLIELHQRLYDVGNPFNPYSPDGLPTVSVLFRGRHYLIPEKSLLAYHLMTHLGYNIRMGGCRLGWLVDIALLFSHEGNNAGKLFNRVKQVNVKATVVLDQIVSYCMPLMCDRARNAIAVDCGIEAEDIPLSYLSNSQKEISLNHKKIIVRNILQTPGLKNKMALFYRVLFPSEEYMAFFYAVTNRRSLIAAHFKRLTGQK